MKSKKAAVKEWVVKDMSYMINSGIQVNFKEYCSNNRIVNRTVDFYMQSTNLYNGLCRYEKAVDTLQHITNDIVGNFAGFYFSDYSVYAEVIKAWSDFSNQDYKTLL